MGSFVKELHALELEVKWHDFQVMILSTTKREKKNKNINGQERWITVIYYEIRWN